MKLASIHGLTSHVLRTLDISAWGEAIAFSLKSYYRWKCLSWKGYRTGECSNLGGAVAKGDTQGHPGTRFPLLLMSLLLLLVVAACHTCVVVTGVFLVVWDVDGGRFAATVPASNTGEIPEEIGQLVVRGSLYWVLWLQNNYLSGIAWSLWIHQVFKNSDLAVFYVAGVLSFQDFFVVAIASEKGRHISLHLMCHRPSTSVSKCIQIPRWEYSLNFCARGEDKGCSIY